MSAVKITTALVMLGGLVSSSPLVNAPGLLARSEPASTPPPSAAPSNPPSSPPSPPASSPTQSIPGQSTTASTPPPVTSPTTTSTTSTTGSAATPTYTINVEVGSSSFDAGNANIWNAASMWDQVCGAEGCDGGTNVNFNYEYVSGGIISNTTGHWTMSGNSPNDADITNALLGAIQVAFQRSQQCHSVTGEICPLCERTPETGPIACDCQYGVQIEDCTYVNYISATADIPVPGGSAQSASITMQGYSGPEGDFNCGEVFGIAEGASKIVSLSPYIQGAETIAQVFCEIFTGGK